MGSLCRQTRRRWRAHRPASRSGCAKPDPISWSCRSELRAAPDRSALEIAPKKRAGRFEAPGPSSLACGLRRPLLARRLPAQKPTRDCRVVGSDAIQLAENGAARVTLCLGDHRRLVTIPAIGLGAALDAD